MSLGANATVRVYSNIVLSGLAIQTRSAIIRCRSYRPLPLNRVIINPLIIIIAIKTAE